MCLLHWTLATTQDTRKQSQPHDHLVDSNALVVVRSGSALCVQQAAEKDKFTQAKLLTEYFIIMVLLLPQQHLFPLYCSFVIISSIYSASSFENGQRNSLFGNNITKTFQNSASASAYFQHLTFTCAYTHG